MNTKFHPHLPLYHGTIDLYADLLIQHGIKIIKRPNSGVDFGPGFYLTVDRKRQAEEWAVDKASRLVDPAAELLEMLGMTMRDFIGMKNKVRPVLLSYQIVDIEEWYGLPHEIFTSADEDWQRHVWHCRRHPNQSIAQAWTFGPVADGGLYRQSHETIAAHPDMNQLSIHHDKAARKLQLVEVIRL